MSTASSILFSQERLNNQHLLATDYLPVMQKNIGFAANVAALQLSKKLADKILTLSIGHCSDHHSTNKQTITIEDEHELASEVLLARHEFTNQLLCHPIFRQAALSVIQNIYLFKHRKLFFHTDDRTTEVQRQQALAYFSNTKTQNIPLADTLQHPIVARIWRRVINSAELESIGSAMNRLHQAVERLNTLRNCYMLLATRLARSAAAKQPALYREGLPFEDTVQVGLMGVGKAAYRYHPSSGVRFSTYATNYINREIQQQALEARLIKISSNTIEKFQHAIRKGKDNGAQKHGEIIQTSSVSVGFATSQIRRESLEENDCSFSPIIEHLEQKEIFRAIHKAIDTELSPKAADFLKRRYGFPPYQEEQSIIEISEAYGVTRSAVYQLEQSVMGKLRHLFSTAQACTT